MSNLNHELWNGDLVALADHTIMQITHTEPSKSRGSVYFSARVDGVTVESTFTREEARSIALCLFRLSEGF